ncbi:MAG: AAA family ATPase [Prevotellaceae bacterium]|nr:AAA family ATPase [Prevotellaceae bacterium]
MKFTWIPFYKEFASKLMQFRNDRKELRKLIHDHKDELYADYVFASKDIDPFTVFGIFNRGLDDDKRNAIAEVFKQLLKMKKAVPKDFAGIPVLNNLKACFFGFGKDQKEGDIERLWQLFEKALNGEDFGEVFDAVRGQYGVKFNITMGLYWIRPDEWLALDSCNRSYLKEIYGIKTSSNLPDYKGYTEYVDEVRQKMKSKKMKEKSFCELSVNAWRWMSDKDQTSDTKAEDDSFYSEYTRILRKRQCVVLQGAPGTGKTYCVPELVTRLCLEDGEELPASRGEIISKYNELKREGRVVFATFHQSMDYEDWMEGLRPVVNDNQVTYEIATGVFKALCERAERPLPAKEGAAIREDATVWKVSLYGTGENPIRTDCLKNGYIRIGWDKYGKDIAEDTDWSLYKEKGKGVLNAFINNMRTGDVVLTCFSSRTIDAIGVVTGDYEWHDELSTYKRVRKVKWLVKGIDEDIVKLNDGKTMMGTTVYKLNDITMDKVKTLLDAHKAGKVLNDNTRPYVMVIDELNRGNISKIFGELITLLEADKRKGREAEESAWLPYSKKPFSIPPNVFVVATMNTADRSLGTLDYAVRRRFAFLSVKPRELDCEGFQADLFRKVSELFISNYDEYATSGFDDTIELRRAETLSEEYRPEEVWPGHSYFIMHDEQDIRDRLRYEVIPLLEEYIRDGVLTGDAEQKVNELRNWPGDESSLS